MTLDGASDEASLAVRCLAGKTDEQNASTRLTLSIDKLAEVLVLREQYGARVRSQREDVVIRRTGTGLDDRLHGVTVRSQRLDDLLIHALVGDQFHRSGGFVRIDDVCSQGTSRERESDAHRVFREMRMRF